MVPTTGEPAPRFLKDHWHKKSLAETDLKTQELARKIRSRGFGCAISHFNNSHKVYGERLFENKGVGFSQVDGFILGNNNIDGDQIQYLPLWEGDLDYTEFKNIEGANSGELARGEMKSATQTIIFANPVSKSKPLSPLAMSERTRNLDFLKRAFNISIDPPEYYYIYITQQAPSADRRPGNFLSLYLAMPKDTFDEVKKLAESGYPIEQLVQALYPRLIGPDRATQIPRYMADKLRIIDKTAPGMEDRFIRLDPIVGEIKPGDPQVFEVPPIY